MQAMEQKLSDTAIERNAGGLKKDVKEQRVHAEEVEYAA
jgi:hypothetical protein